MSAEDIPCAAGVRGDGSCSFELCPPGIGCRRVREQKRQGEGRAVLGEQEPVGESGLTASEEMVVRHLQPYITALVAQARRDGAAEERERIASRFDSMDGDGWGSLAPVVAGLFEQVARIVRARRDRGQKRAAPPCLCGRCGADTLCQVDQSGGVTSPPR